VVDPSGAVVSVSSGGGEATSLSSSPLAHATGALTVAANSNANGSAVA
jgi:hypothetical protein